MEPVTEARRFKAVVIGGSAGGIDALVEILFPLPRDFPLPIVVVLHLPADKPSILAQLFTAKTRMRVKDAEANEILQAGTVYFAPPGYHLVIERDFKFALSKEDQVQFSRPSIDVLFESAAQALKGEVIGVLLTGASRDGSKGLKRIQLSGGFVIIQNPESALVRTMPDAACALIPASERKIMSLGEIANFLAAQSGREGEAKISWKYSKPNPEPKRLNL